MERIDRVETFTRVRLMISMQGAGVRRTAAVFLLVASVSAASAAELRTSAGDRPVVRQAAMSLPPEMYTEETEATEFVGPTSGSCGGCGVCQSCCLRTYGFWADIDFLLGWRHGIRNPPLVTSSPNGTPAAVAGVLGQPTTSIVYPTEAIGEEARPGARVAIGAWLDPCHCWGVEGRYFALADERTRFDVTSDGDPILARPFFDVAGNAQAALLVAFPGIVSPGNITVQSDSEILGGDALVRRSLCRWDCGRMDLLVGYQFSRIDQSLMISNQLTDADPNNLIPDGTTLLNADNFLTRNEYHAISFGAQAQYENGPWRLDLMGKIGLGNMQETVTISGLSVTDNPPLGVPDFVDQSGLLAQGANLGTFTQDTFAVSPEINVKLHYYVTPCLDVSVGYMFVYWSDVAHPGLQIDPNLQVPPGPFAIRDDEAWVHALTLGVAWQF
jgi:hypothetical protein